MRVGGIGAAVLPLAFFMGLLAPRGAAAQGPDLLALGAGVYDALHDNPVAQIRGEYRFGYRFYFLEPIAGALATADGTFYGYGGLRADFVLGDHFVIMPVAAAGLWHRGSGKDLGSPIEFKTGGEFAYRFDNDSRLGIAFDHISNAGIGRKKNPGVESLLLVYSLPLR